MTYRMRRRVQLVAASLRGPQVGGPIVRDGETVTLPACARGEVRHPRRPDPREVQR